MFTRARCDLPLNSDKLRSMRDIDATSGLQAAGRTAAISLKDCIKLQQIIKHKSQPTSMFRCVHNLLSLAQRLPVPQPPTSMSSLQVKCCIATALGGRRKARQLQFQMYELQMALYPCLCVATQRPQLASRRCPPAARRSRPRARSTAAAGHLGINMARG